MHRTGLTGLTALFMLACNSTSDADAGARLEGDATAVDAQSHQHDSAVSDTTVPDSRTDSAASSRRDAGPSGPFDAPVCALPEETGDPPPDCIAPCMWAVMKSCHLSKCCVVEESTGAYRKICDRQGVLEISASFGGMSSEVVYAADGSRCYSSTAQGVPGPGAGSSGGVTFSNGKGEPFAVMEWVPGSDGLRRVSCAGQVFNVDLAQPKCAPWNHKDCVVGMCPDPP